MVKTTLILLQITLVVSSALGRNVDPEKGLVYIGSFKSKNIQGSGLETRDFDENNYYVSINPTVWASADEDCHNILGPNGGLVAIESLEEWDFLKEALENYGLGSTYWTSGRYSAATSEWIWSLNDQPLPPNPPWAEGFPTLPNLFLRVLIYHTNRYNANWRTVLETQIHRYICEVYTNQGIEFDM